MNSGTNQEQVSQNLSISNEIKAKPSQFNLSSDQFIIIQHYLPKGYALIEKRCGVLNYSKRERGSSKKLQDSENYSKLSGGIQNADETEGRSKRNRIKKIDRYLEDQMPKPNKRVPSQKTKKEEITNPYIKILTILKKNANAFPFLEPVDPNISGASNYFEIIKEPMDLATVEANYQSGMYSSMKEFNDDIRKIWKNSYEFNDAASKIHKMTIEMEKLHNKLMSGMENTSKHSGGNKQRSKMDQAKKSQNSSTFENIQKKVKK